LRQKDRRVIWACHDVHDMVWITQLEPSMRMVSHDQLVNALGRNV
jgi:hypothetical protein